MIRQAAGSYRPREGEFQAMRLPLQRDEAVEQVIIDWIRDSGGEVERKTLGYSTYTGDPFVGLEIASSAGPIWTSPGKWVVKTGKEFRLMDHETFVNVFEESV